MPKPSEILPSRPGVALWLAVALSGPSGAQFPPGVPSHQSGFPVTVDGTQITSPVSLGDLNGDGLPDIVVAGKDGKVHAYDGFGSKLWERDTGDEEIRGKPAIGDVDGDGFAEVVVGAGGFTGGSGGVWVLSHLGAEQCYFPTLDSDSNGKPDGVYSSPALADLDGNDGGRLEIAFGSWDRHIRVLHHDCTTLWERSQLPPTGLADYFFDTVWSSPALADVNGDGQLDVVIGVDSPDASPNVVPVGGAVHVLDGLTGLEVPGFPIPLDEVVWSSPALADLTGDDRFDIAVGTGYCWENPACAPAPAGAQAVQEALYAWSADSNPLIGWPFELHTAGNLMQGTHAMSSPALADLDGDGQLEVIINTSEAGDPEGGQLYAIEAYGKVVPGWPVRPVLPASPTTTISRSTSHSPIVADLTGDGDLEVILPSNWDLVIFDKDGNQLSVNTFPPVPGDFVLSTTGPIGGTAAVGDLDGDGDLELVGAGFATLSPATGGIYVWDFDAPASSAAPWPMFRRTSDNRGTVANVGLIFADGFESGDTSLW